MGYTQRALKLPETVTGEVDASQFGGGRLGETEICSVSLKLGQASKKVQKHSAVQIKCSFYTPIDLFMLADDTDPHPSLCLLLYCISLVFGKSVEASGKE